MKIKLVPGQQFIVTPYVLQQLLNDGNDKFTVDFGAIQMEAVIKGKKSEQDQIIKETKSGKVNSNSRSKERPDDKVREVGDGEQRAARSIEQETEVAE